MKHFITFFAFIIVLISCVNRDIETIATDNLKRFMKEILVHPSDAKLLNVHSTYKSDSLCIIQFTLKAKNRMGNECIDPYEYIYFIDNNNGKAYESVTELNPVDPIDYSKYQDKIEEFILYRLDFRYVYQHKVKDVKEEFRESILYDFVDPSDTANIEDRLMYAAAWIKLIAHGREVPDKKSKDIEL